MIAYPRAFHAAYKKPSQLLDGLVVPGQNLPGCDRGMKERKTSIDPEEKGTSVPLSGHLAATTNQDCSLYIEVRIFLFEDDSNLIY